MQFVRKLKKIDIFFGICFGALLLFYLWRVHYGYVETDEQFWLVGPYTLTNGDRLIIDTWHPTQLYGAVMYPLNAIYHALTSGTDGIFLTYRSIYVIIHLLVGMALHVAMRKYSDVAALLSFILFAVYMPYGQMCFGYNECGMFAITLIMALSLLLQNHEKWFGHVLIGVLIASLVLCNPMCVVLYAIQFVYWIIRWIKKGGFKDKQGLVKLIYIHVGIAVMCFIFLLLTYKGGSLYEYAREMKHNLPMMMSDGTHGAKGIKEFMDPIVWFVREFWIWPSIYVILAIAGTIDKKRRIFYMMCLIADGIWFIGFMIYRSGWFWDMQYMLLLMPIGLMAYLWMDEKPKDVFARGYCLSIAYAAMVNYASNNGILIISHGCALASCVSVVLILLWLQEQRDVQSAVSSNNTSLNNRKYVVICTCLFGILLSIQIGFHAYHRVVSNFWEENTQNLDTVITTGPMKGIHTTREKAERYELQNKEISSIPADSEDMILFFVERTDGYLMTDAHVGSFSVYVFEENAPDTDRFMRYYDMHPERIPNYIYVDAKSVGRQDESYWIEFSTSKGYNITYEDSGAYLLWQE